MLLLCLTLGGGLRVPSLPPSISLSLCDRGGGGDEGDGGEAGNRPTANSNSEKKGANSNSEKKGGEEASSCTRREREGGKRNNNEDGNEKLEVYCTRTGVFLYSCRRAVVASPSHRPVERCVVRLVGWIGPGGGGVQRSGTERVHYIWSNGPPIVTLEL